MPVKSHPSRPLRTILAAAAVVSAALAAHPAQAAIMLMRQEFRIADVLAGSAGLREQLTGKAFVLTMKYDTERGDILNLGGPNPGDGFDQEILYNTAESHPVLAVSYSLDGAVHEMNSIGNLSLRRAKYVSDGEISYSALGLDLNSVLPGDEFNMYSIFALHGPVQHVSLDHDAPLELHEMAYDLGSDPTFSFDRGDVFGDLVFARGETSVVIQRLDVAPVPEPTTWSLMIIGFGVSGALLRRRRYARA